MAAPENCRQVLMFDTTFSAREETHLACADLCNQKNWPSSLSGIK